MRAHTGRTVAVACGISGIVAAALLTGACAPSEAAATVVPEVAPYFETTGAHTGNLRAAVTGHGLKSFTAAFVLGSGCTPTWDDASPLSTATAKNALVSNAKSAGAVPIISFGGESGTELAQSCPSPTKTPNTTNLVSAYSSVINRFGVSKVDFDIEGSAISDTSTNSYRFLAIKALEVKYAKLEVSVTVPVSQSGLLSSAVAFLKSAKTNGARIDVVNIMTMSYGSPVSNMGAAAVTSARDTLAQLKTIWSASTYHNLGITPMIGRNDSPGETFSWADSQTVLAFAKQNGVRRLAFWAVNRDQSCGSGDTLPNSCTGVSQQPLDYTDGFLN